MNLLLPEHFYNIFSFLFYFHFIFFFQLGKKPPVFTVADLPGYGHAVASDDDKRFWKTMIRDYLGNRQVISRYVTVQRSDVSYSYSTIDSF